MGDRSNNGGRTRPLTDHSLTVLRRCAEHPVPIHKVNYGVKDRLTRTPRPLAEVVEIEDRRYLKATPDGQDLVTFGHLHVWLPLSYSPDRMRLLLEVCDECQKVREAPRA